MFQRLCHVQSDFEMFVKLAAKIGGCTRKTPSAHYASGAADSMQILSFL